MKYSFLPFILALLVLSVSAQAQVQKINTIAGDGVQGYSGDGHSAVAAELFSPLSVAVDNEGDVFIADHANSRVRKVFPNGIITTIAGIGSTGITGDGSVSTSARVTPFCLALDKHHNLFISDVNYSVVRKINALGIISTVAGTGLWGYNGDGIPATAALLKEPYGLAVDNNDNLYIADAGNNVIRKVDTAGIITTVAGMDTVSGFSGDNGAATAAKLDSPYAVVVDGAGNLYINDFNNNVIRKVDGSGIITTYAGTPATYNYTGDGGAATAATFNKPKGIALDTCGNLFIADADNNVIRKVDLNGVITTVAGNGTVGFGGDLGLVNGANLNNPYGVAVDYAGSIYIADANNQRIRKTYTYLSVNNAPVAAAISAYPNPFSNEITVSGLTASDRLSLYDIVGRQVSDTWAVKNAGTQSFSISGVSAGIYVLQVWNNEGARKAILQVVKE